MIMKTEIVSEKENPLMKRKACWLSVEHTGKETPSRNVVLPEVVKKLGSKEELTVIDKIFSERGIAKSRVKVLVYYDKKDMPKPKPEKKAGKSKPADKGPANEAEKSAPVAEKPKEKVKEVAEEENSEDGE